MSLPCTNLSQNSCISLQSGRRPENPLTTVSLWGPGITINFVKSVTWPLHMSWSEAWPYHSHPSHIYLHLVNPQFKYQTWQRQGTTLLKYSICAWVWTLDLLIMNILTLKTTEPLSRPSMPWSGLRRLYVSDIAMNSLLTTGALIMTMLEWFCFHFGLAQTYAHLGWFFCWTSFFRLSLVSAFRGINWKNKRW